MEVTAIDAVNEDIILPVQAAEDALAALTERRGSTSFRRDTDSPAEDAEVDGENDVAVTEVAVTDLEVTEIIERANELLAGVIHDINETLEGVPESETEFQSGSEPEIDPETSIGSETEVESDPESARIMAETLEESTEIEAPEISVTTVEIGQEITIETTEGESVSVTLEEGQSSATVEIDGETHIIVDENLSREEAENEVANYVQSWLGQMLLEVGPELGAIIVSIVSNVFPMQYDVRTEVNERENQLRLLHEAQSRETDEMAFTQPAL